MREAVIVAAKRTPIGKAYRGAFNNTYGATLGAEAIRASDVDVVWVNGYGWPVYRGGPMFYGDLVGGPSVVLAKMKEFEAKMGDQFKPAPLLEKLAAEGKTFADLKG